MNFRRKLTGVLQSVCVDPISTVAPSLGVSTCSPLWRWGTKVWALPSSALPVCLSCCLEDDSWQKEPVFCRSFFPLQFYDLEPAGMDHRPHWLYTRIIYLNLYIEGKYLNDLPHHPIPRCNPWNAAALGILVTHNAAPLPHYCSGSFILTEETLKICHTGTCHQMEGPGKWWRAHYWTVSKQMHSFLA